MCSGQTWAKNSEFLAFILRLKVQVLWKYTMTPSAPFKKVSWGDPKRLQKHTGGPELDSELATRRRKRRWVLEQ